MSCLQHSPNINTMVLMIGMKPAAVCPTSLWELKSKLTVALGGMGPGGQAVLWEIMVRVREARNMSRLDAYSRALRPALSIKQAAVATEKRRTAPTRAALNLTDTEQEQERVMFEASREQLTFILHVTQC